MDFRASEKIAVIGCGVLERELRNFSRDIPELVNIRILEQGLHEKPERLRQALQDEISACEREDNPSAIALAYGLCSRGIEGVYSTKAKLVLPLAHDCITLLLGDKDKYADYIAANPGTYWYSPGWIATNTQPGQERYETTLAQYAEAYGEDNAEYLMEMEQGWMREYNRATYVDLGDGDTEKDIAYTKRCAEWLNWSYDRLHGEPGLLVDLVCGKWDDERFLVLEPGQTPKFVDDGRIMIAATVCATQEH